MWSSSFGVMAWKIKKKIFENIKEIRRKNPYGLNPTLMEYIKCLSHMHLISGAGP